MSSPSSLLEKTKHLFHGKEILVTSQPTKIEWPKANENDQRNGKLNTEDGWLVHIKRAESSLWKENSSAAGEILDKIDKRGSQNLLPKLY